MKPHLDCIPAAAAAVAAATVAAGIRVTVDTATPGLHPCCKTWAALLLLLLLMLQLLLLPFLLAMSLSRG